MTLYSHNIVAPSDYLPPPAPARLAPILLYCLCKLPAPITSQVVIPLSLPSRHLFVISSCLCRQSRKGKAGKVFTQWGEYAVKKVVSIERRFQSVVVRKGGPRNLGRLETESVLARVGDVEEPVRTPVSWVVLWCFVASHGSQGFRVVSLLAGGVAGVGKLRQQYTAVSPQPSVTKEREW